MGMAASQARYLALVARKSNCEYEGQQINQARTALSNQSADLFNQMLGLEVPTPPSTQDFTVTQYSYTDGVNESVISSWQQLSEADPEFNYVVTHHYMADRYTGSMKKMNDPQVQYDGNIPASVGRLQNALENINSTYEKYLTAKEATDAKMLEASKLENYELTATPYKGVKKVEHLDTETDKDTYQITYGDTPSTAKFQGYYSLEETEKAAVDAALAELKREGALTNPNLNEICYDSTNKTIAFRSDIESLHGGTMGGTTTTLKCYGEGYTGADNDIKEIAAKYDKEITALSEAESKAYDAYDAAVKEYEALEHPTYIGNCELTPLASLTEDEAAELRQICYDMKENDIDADILDCFSDKGDYLGGVYSFQLNGVKYYTTLGDLEASYLSEHEVQNNDIDSQPEKLAYYNATYISTKVEKTEKALLQTDSEGRFSSIKFEDDSVTYALNVENVTDEAAYADAMNQYYYKNAIYDKTIQDINAKTSIIQQQDQQLELRMKQLDTERNALSNEIEAVSKVVGEAVEAGFKTFGG